MTLKVAIVGCGKIADGHIEEIQKMPELGHVVAVCDLEPIMAEQIAFRYAVPSHYGKFENLLQRERPDVVHITTPPAAHLPLTRQALDAGCHVYVEKPLTPTHAQAVELVRLVEQAGKKLTIGYTYLFDPPAIAMRELVAQGVLGDPVHVESFYGYNLAGPFGAALLGDGTHWVHRLPGKLFQNNFDHALNKLVEFIDDESPAISAFATTRRVQRFGDDRDAMQDELRVLIRGSATTAYGTFSSHVRPALHLARVYGTRNTLLVDYLMRTVTVESSGTLPSSLGRLVPAFEMAGRFAKEGARNVLRFAKSDFHFFAGLSKLIELYYRSILDDRPPPIPHRDILRISAWSEEIYRQIAASREVVR
ncbi:MAG: Gfo/Idh/MocA family oxidoreductase [Polyangiaceae bacterium]|jgi:predicted dehydrogenase|nr:Gfo/Idh/MocA family oxidoreductase [Polyangiaceae bacterium]